MSAPLFANRRDAGRKLAERLTAYAGRDTLVLALPRGGVPVAREIADALAAPLDVLLVRKIGAPFNPEFGIGAVVDGAPPQVVLNEDAVEFAQAREDYVRDETARQVEELERRRAAYRGARPAPDVRGRTVIVVDDGVATGGTARAALRAMRQAGAKKVAFAAPVGPPDTLARLQSEADEIVCLAAPPDFRSVGGYYVDFTQTSDDEVISLLGAPGA